MTSVYNERVDVVATRERIRRSVSHQMTPTTASCPSGKAQVWQLGPRWLRYVYRNDTIDTFIKLDNSLSACTRS